jgi:hypothetical protein
MCPTTLSFDWTIFQYPSEVIASTKREDAVSIVKGRLRGTHAWRQWTFVQRRGRSSGSHGLEREEAEGSAEEGGTIGAHLG